jgi:nucleotide-binding universal stress UspA family protein
VYKDILVHVEDDPACEGRFACASALALRQDAHLAGLYALEVPELPGYVAAQIGEEALHRARATYLARAARVRERLEELARRDGVRFEWREGTGPALELLIAEGRYADLVVVGQPDPEDAGARPEGFPGELALVGGRPVLAVPYAGRHQAFGTRALIAWNASREAARAVHDALPLLAAAEQVVVLAVDAPEAGHIPGADIATHLAHHGVHVEARHTVAPDIAVGDELLNLISDLGADLLVMGAYGRSRWREAVFGGATRHVLAHMTVPVLMAH